MGLLKRLFRLGKSEVNDTISKAEDPIKILKLKIEDLKGILSSATEGLAKVTATKIKMLSDVENLRDKNDSYIEKANKLKVMMGSGSIDQESAKSDIILLLNKHENTKEEIVTMQKQADSQSEIVNRLKNKVVELKNLIESTKRKITLLETQQKAAKANKAISKEMSTLNLDGIKSEMGELENSIISDNAEATSWDELSDSTQSDMDRIDSVINKSSSTNDDVLLSNFLKDSDSE